MRHTFKAIPIHSGQYRLYGDSYYEWDIETDLPEEKILDKCLTACGGEGLPSKEEYRENTKYGGERWGDDIYRFRGYYEFKETEDGYRFTICKPFAD